jgi:hypothetical protein
MSGFRELPDLKRVGGKKPWQLQEELLYDSEEYGGLLRVPAGFRSDMASVPWFFRRVFPKDGDYSYAAIQHDYHCETRPNNIDSKKAARIFREAMISLGVGKWKARSMYRAVLWFGPSWP